MIDILLYILIGLFVLVAIGGVLLLLAIAYIVFNNKPYYIDEEGNRRYYK